jgi:hypothetical protein
MSQINDLIQNKIKKSYIYSYLRTFLPIYPPK